MRLPSHGYSVHVPKMPGTRSVSSVAQLCPTLCDLMDCSTLGLHHQLLELVQAHVHRVGDASNHLILCCPLLLPSIFPNIRVFSNESALRIRWPKYGVSALTSALTISLRMDWLDLLAVQGTLKSLLQHHTVQQHQLFCAQPSLWSNSHIHT